LRDVLEPAIAYASDGYRWSSRVATIKIVEQLFRKHWATSAAVYLPNNEVLSPARCSPTPKLSQTYARILKEAEAQEATASPQIEAARKAWSHGLSRRRSTGSAARRK